MEYILYSVDAGIATITVNRPDKMNALNAAIIQDIGAAVQTALNDDVVGAIIITGAGSKAFVAGADIAEFANYTPAEGKALSAAGHRVFDAIEQAHKPVLAAVNGFALGGGCELAMACHIRIASANAKFGQPEVNLGILPGYGGTQRLVQLIGKGKAMEMLLTADMIAAAEALQLGLITHLVESDELLNKAAEMLHKIMSKGPIAVQHVIQCVNAVHNETQNGFAMETEAFGNIMASTDFKEGTQAFVEKRKAAFTGK